MPITTPDLDALAASGKAAVSIARFADLFDVEPVTVSRDTRRGVILTIPYGRRRLIPMSEVLRIAREGIKPIPSAGEASTTARKLQSTRKKQYWAQLREEAQAKGISLRALQQERARKRGARA